MLESRLMRQAMHASSAGNDGPSTALSTSTDGRTDGLTDKHGHPPDITSPSVTRARAYVEPDRPRFLHVSHTIEAARVLHHIIGTDPQADAHLMTLRWALDEFCTLTGCGYPRKALGLCQTHYDRHRQLTTRNEAHLINRAARGT